MTTDEFEKLLTAVAARLTEEARKDESYRNANKFEARVRTVLESLGKEHGVKLTPSEAQTFPDIVADKFGIEVKVTQQDS